MEISLQDMFSKSKDKKVQHSLEKNNSKGDARVKRKRSQTLV
jgi:hypothetical protein